METYLASHIDVIVTFLSFLGGEEGNGRMRKGKRKSGERGAERWKSDEAESERGGTEGTGGGKKTKGSSRRKWGGIGEKGPELKEEGRRDRGRGRG